ncbi:MAG: sugar porter family MFS transporter [Mariniphaga sp.]|nr:sugar porter family MFS transporter [Mariniphaga sp.]MDD4225003.1 sugar porter family MFS transporter [Mariniphaga sp.]MDD4424654.1 sugar porter family MFS transporter [Mariniphaga sp.]
MHRTKENNLSRIVMLSTIAALGGFLFGFDSGVINGTVDALQTAFHSDAIGTGFNVASVLLGCAIGAFFAGMLADKFGRKATLIGAAIAFIISAWGSGISSSSSEFIVYRLLGGLAVGAASILSPAYIGEIAPPKIRGRLISLQQLAIVLGLFFAFFSNYNLATVAGGTSAKLWWGYDAWQWMFWVELLPAFVFFVSLLFIPESPRYLVAVHKTEKATQILAGITNLENAKKQVAEIRKTVLQERKPRLSDILRQKTKKIHPIVWVGVGLAALQTFTGIDVVFYYGAVLWQAAGFTEGDALLTNVIIGGVNIGFTILAMFLVDRVGRKPLLLIGGLGQAVMLGLMAVIFQLSADDAVEGIEMSGTIGLMALFAAIGFIAFFALTWGPVMWVMLGEMFPNKFRGAALAVAGMANWLANFLVTITFPVILARFGLGVSYGIYAVFGVVAFVFVYRYVHETKGKTLEELSLEQE